MSHEATMATSEEEKTMISRYKGGAKEATERLVLCNYVLVRNARVWLQSNTSKGAYCSQLRCAQGFSQKTILSKHKPFKCETCFEP